MRRLFRLRFLRYPITWLIILGILGCYIAWAGIQMLFSPRESITEESNTPGSFYGGFIAALPMGMHVPMMITLGVIHLLVGGTMIYVPAAVCNFVPSPINLSNTSLFPSGGTDFSGASDTSDVIGYKLEKEMAAKYPEYYFEYDETIGDLYVVNRQTTDFTYFEIYLMVLDDMDEGEIRSEVDVDFEADIAMVKSDLYESIEDYNLDRDNLMANLKDFQPAPTDDTDSQTLLAGTQPISADPLSGQPTPLNNGQPMNPVQGQMAPSGTATLAPPGGHLTPPGMTAQDQNIQAQQQSQFQQQQVGQPTQQQIQQYQQQLAAQQQAQYQQQQQQQVQAPPLSDAEKHLEQAADLWDSGNSTLAMEHAQYALKIKIHYLGAEHQECIDLNKMLSSAGGQ